MDVALAKCACASPVSNCKYLYLLIYNIYLLNCSVKFKTGITSIKTLRQENTPKGVKKDDDILLEAKLIPHTHTLCNNA